MDKNSPSPAESPAPRPRTPIVVPEATGVRPGHPRSSLRGDAHPNKNGDTAVRQPLTQAQADGLACVACGRDYLHDPARTPSSPVGQSATGSQIFACAPGCVDQAAGGAR
ncbi:hypothetical protein GCM10010174_62070 [Kutzneria viridogrisea]|uniref:Recombination endonuclease VII n=1 Tax=Kutzneria viridogrisea TaxID=47990 RepID=A0ABR6BG75_9PSEU|nr:hypothetical protein [Kutzneria viridogrisea]